MNSGQVTARLAAAVQSVAANAEEKLAASLAARAADALAGSDVVITGTADGGVALQAKGLRARAFGSRHRAPDPRFAGLLATLARGDVG